MSKHAVARLDEIELQDDGREPYRPVRHHFGITAFGVTAWTARAAGDRILNEHDEADDGSEELYLVTQGHASFELDGEKVDAPAGTFVFAPPGVKRTAFAEEAGTTILAVGGKPGEAYEPSGWELWAPFAPTFQAGGYVDVIERLAPVAEANPQYPILVYNLACAESLAGRTEAAIGHLRQAIERSERFREYAKTDSDLEPLRGEPAFEELGL